MKCAFVAFAVALTAIFSSCQKSENTPYSPADSFVIGDEAFFERFEVASLPVLYKSEDINHTYYQYSFVNSNPSLVGVRINGEVGNGEDVHGNYVDYKSWVIIGVEVLGEYKMLERLITFDSVSNVQLEQVASFRVSSFKDTLSYYDKSPFSIIKDYSMGDTVNWEEDDQLISWEEREAMKGLGIDYGQGNRISPIFNIGFYDHKLPSWENTFQREINHSIDLSTNKFIVCKYQWQPENPPAGFDDEIEKLMVIEIALNQDSLIDVVNVYNERYLPL